MYRGATYTESFGDISDQVFSNMKPEAFSKYYEMVENRIVGYVLLPGEMEQKTNPQKEAVTTIVGQPATQPLNI